MLKEVEYEQNMRLLCVNCFKRKWIIVIRYCHLMEIVGVGRGKGNFVGKFKNIVDLSL